MKSLVLMLPAVLGYAALVYHSLRFRGPRQTLILFLGTYVFGFLKEYRAHLNLDFAEYEFMLQGPRIGNTPLFVPIGWTFAVYLSWSFAEKIADRFRAFRGSMLPVLGLSILGMGAISMCVETTGTNVGWWVWNEKIMGRDPHDQWVWGTPVGVFIGWALFCLAFCLPFFLAEKTRWRRHWSVPVGWALGVGVVYLAYFPPGANTQPWRLGYLFSLLFFAFIAPWTSFFFKIPYERDHLDRS